MKERKKEKRKEGRKETWIQGKRNNGEARKQDIKKENAVGDGDWRINKQIN